MKQSDKSSATIFRINLSPGGVPKLQVPQAETLSDGLVGDSHHDTDVHGGPERAICLYSLERIRALQAEGHPIFPGSTGENLTLVGIVWEKMAPGLQLQIGTQVLLEVTRYTAPCKTIAGSFRDGNSNRISQKLHPGWSRVYCRVLKPGTISVDDRVEVLPGG